MLYSRVSAIRAWTVLDSRVEAIRAWTVLYSRVETIRAWTMLFGVFTQILYIFGLAQDIYCFIVLHGHTTPIIQYAF